MCRARNGCYPPLTPAPLSPIDPAEGGAAKMPAAGMATSRDAFFGGKVALFQPRSGYRIALDTVWLQATVPFEASSTVLDVGAGVGGCAILAANRCAHITVVALELQHALSGLARRNAVAAGLADRVMIVRGDLARPPVAPSGFDCVLTNPPYHAAGRASLPTTAVGQLARHEGTLDLKAWLQASWRLVAAKGRLTLIHRADRLAEILAAIEPLGGALTVFPLWPKAGRPAGRVLVQLRKTGKAPMRLLAGLVVHEAKGTFTPDAAAILAGERTLFLE